MARCPKLPRDPNVRAMLREDVATGQAENVKPTALVRAAARAG